MKGVISKLVSFLLKICPVDGFPPLYYNKNKYNIISVNYSHSSDETVKDTLIVRAEKDAQEDKVNQLKKWLSDIITKIKEFLSQY